MIESFNGLKPFQLSEYIFLALFAFFVPISWRIATYIMIGLAISCIFKGIFEEGFKRNNLQYKNKYVYIISIAFWVLYAISFFYSENTAEARVQIGKKLSFLLFPLFFMTSNLSYLTKERIRTVMYCFVWGILALYIVNFVWAIYDISYKDYSLTRLTSYYRFFKVNGIFEFPHRAYFSIFTCLGLAFCFKELFASTSIKIFNLISLLLMTMSPFFVTSRAGMLCEVLIFFILWIWLTFVKKEVKIGIITGVVMIAFLVIGYFAFPKSIDRFTSAIDKVKEGKGDIRLTLRNSNRYAIKDNYIFGAGSGDRCDESMKAYEKYRKDIISRICPVENADLECFEQNRKSLFDSINIKYGNELTNKVYKYAESISEELDCDYNSVKQNLPEYHIINHIIKHEMNAHNQFSDTIIAVGIIGLLLLLGFFFMPIYLWIKNKNFDIVLFSLLFIIAFNCLFESVFERQMGIMFFTFFYFLLFHADFCQQTDDNNIPNLKP